MKTKAVNVFSILAASVLLGLSMSSAHAASGNWNADAAGNWSDATKWSSNPTVPGTVAGDTVGLTFNLTTARIVTIDATSRTVGTLNIGDPTTSFFAYTLAASGGASLTFDNSGGGAQLNQSTAGGAADTITAPLSLADNLTVNNVNGLTLSGVVSSPGAVSITKSGAGMLTINGANTFVASTITVNGGTLYIPKTAAANGVNGALGNVSGGGMQIYVNSGATLSSGNNNWFGGNTLADTSMPTMNITGGIMAITNQYSTIGALNLTNGAIMTSTGTGSATYQGFQLRGNVTVGGTTSSTISGSRDYHLNSTTVFDVENVAATPAGLVVSANLRNQSGDFANASGGLTKTGPGVMMLTGPANVFSSVAGIQAGTLQIGDGSANNGSMVASIDISSGATLVFANPTAWTYTNSITDAGNVVKTGAGTLTLGAINNGAIYGYSGSTVVSNGVLLFAAPQSGGGSVTVKDGAGLGVVATTDGTYDSPSSLTLGNSAGANLQFGVFGTTTPVLSPSTLTINGTATINISSAPFVSGVSYPLFINYSGGTLALGTQPGGIFGYLTNNSGTVSYVVTNATADHWTAAVNTNWDTTTANWTNSLPGNTFSTGFPVQFDDAATGASPLLVYIPSAVTPGQLVFSNVMKNYIIGGAAISGSGNVTMLGSGTVTLTNVNTFTGSLIISNGSFAIAGAGQLGGGNYSTVITDNGTLSVNSSAAQTLSGVISGSGFLVKSNTGNLTLTSANTFSGGLTVSNGTAFLGNNSAAGTGIITLAGGTLNNTINGLVLANNINVTAASALVINAGNWNLNGNLTGSGNLTYTPAGNAATLALVGDNSGYAGTFTVSGANAAFQWSAASAGSASATWVLSNTFASGGRMRFGGWSGTIDIGALSGNGIGLINNTAGTVTMNVGALNTSTTFSGTMITGAGVIDVAKVGTGSLTLSGASSRTGLTTIQNGSLVAGANAPVSANGPFGNASSAIALGDSTSLGSAYSPSLMINGPFIVGRAIAVGAATGGNASTYTVGELADTNATFSGNISLNQSLSVSNVLTATTNALTISGVIGSLDGANPSVTFTGPGNIKLTVANTYSGNTVISGGKLILSGSGNIGSSAKISVASGATFDVSGVTASPYTLSGAQTLLGSGTVTGAVATASSSSSISPATNGVVGTLTFNGNLNLSSGATLYFDLSTSHLSGNDQIAVGGNLTAGSSDTVHINALSGAANLDQTADYVLMTCAGTTTMSTQPTLLFDNTAPANASHYSVQKSGNNVVLHYSATAAPVVTSVIVTNTADGSTTAARYQTVTVYATVSPGAGTITSVTANLTSIGGSAAQAINNLGGNNYSYTATVGAGAQVGSDVITVTANDSLSNSGANSATLTVTPAAMTWSGFGADNLWGTGNNWVGSNPPGFSGDSVIFTGSFQTTANMNSNYAVTALTFDGGASSFTITNPAGTVLTLNGPLDNNSGSPQTLTMPIVVSAPQIVNDAGFAGITLAGPVSGAGAVTVNGGYVTLAGSNSYAADTTVNGTLKVGSSAAIPSGSGKGNVTLAGTLDLNGTNASINNLIGGAGVVDNTSATSPSTLTIGANNDVINLTGVTIQNTGGTNLSLVKLGTGSLTLATANTYAGGTTLSNGTLTVAGNSSPTSGTVSSGPLGTGTLTLAGGTFNNNGGSTIANNIIAAGSNNVQAVAGNFTWNGTITGNGILHQTVNGSVSQLGLGGDNSGFTGTWIQDAGATSLRFDSPNSGSAGAAWVFNQSQNSQRVRFNFGTGTINFGSMAGGSGNVGLANISSGAQVATLSVGALNTSTTFSGGIEANGANGIIALTKVGTGSLTLTAANTYGGPTTVSNGTLVITSAHTGNGDFVVNDNKTLGVINNGGSQTALLGNLTLGDNAGSSKLFFTNVASTTIPVITVASAVTQNGTCNIAISNSVVNTGVYPLIKYGSLAGAGSFALSVPSGVTATLTNDTGNLWIALNVTVGNGVSTNPTNITTVVSGNQLVLSWPADHIGWRLQAQSNSLSTGLGTNWVNVPNTSTVNSYTNVINAANGSVFYRMVYP